MQFNYNVLILWFGLIGFPVLNYSQDIYKSNLIQDSLLAKKYSDLAWKYRDSYPDSTHYYAKHALQISYDLRLNKLVAYSLADIGNYYKRLENYDSAFWYLHKSLSVRLQNDNLRDQISGYNLLALAHSQKENFDSAFSYYNKAIEICDKKNHPDLFAKLLDGKGVSFAYMGKYQEGFELIYESLKLHEELNDSSGMAKNWQNLGFLYQETNQLVKSLDAYKKAKNIYRIKRALSGVLDVMINEGGILALEGKLEEAENHFKECLILSKKTGFLTNLSPIYNNLAWIYHAKGNLKQAIYFHKEDLLLARSNKKTIAFIEAGLNLSQVLIELKQITEAEILLGEVEDSLNKIQIPLFEATMLRLKGELNAETRSFDKAYKFLQSSRSIFDSVEFVLRKARDLADQVSLEKYEKEQLKASIIIQKTELAKQKAENKVQLIILIGGFVVMLLTFIAGLIFFRNQKLKLQTLQAKNDAAQERENRLKRDKEVSSMLKEAELNNLEFRLSSQQEIREQIAKDLHDQLGSELALVQITFQALQKHLASFSKDLQKKYQDGINRLDLSCENVRKLASRMHQNEISSEGLIQTLNRFCRTINDSGMLNVQLIHTGIDLPTSEENSSEIYKMVKTLLDNVLRHADATEAIIQLVNGSESLLISIEDDGKGFDQTEKNFQLGLGLYNVKHRAQKLGGTTNIESKIGKGTLITVQIPT